VTRDALLAPRATLLGVPAAWAAGMLLLPLAVLALASAGTRPEAGGVVYDGGFGGWTWIGENGGVVAGVAWRSLRIATLATLACLLIATPVAWWIARAPRSRRGLLLLLVVVPSWTSFLLRTYSWRWLFGTEGPVNGALEALGIGAVRFLDGEGAVVLGLVHGYLPFAVLPIYAAVERLDPTVLAAARDLGASPARAYWSVGFPLTRTGTLAGATLVFVPCLAAFVTPALLGGKDTYMVGQLAQHRYLTARDAPGGAALGVLLALAAFLVLGGAALVTRRRRV
jgi:ABC-type spermidine/putrescine transport system permease subunit I